jgi:hypothetical protein
VTSPQQHAQQLATMQKQIDLLNAIVAQADHPVRTRIAFWLAERSKGSPVQFHRDNPDVTLGTTSYHFRIMNERREIKKSGRRPVRGATEHFYSLSKGHLLNGGR